MSLLSVRRVALIDAGPEQLPLLHLIGNAPDLQLLALHLRDGVDAEALFAAAGLPAAQFAAPSPQQAFADGRTYVSTQPDAAIAAAGVEVVLLAGDNPAAGLARALLAIELGRALLEANAPCAALVGPLLARRAAEHGCSYRPDPGSTLGQVLRYVDVNRPTTLIAGHDPVMRAVLTVIANVADYRLQAPGVAVAAPDPGSGNGLPTAAGNDDLIALTSLRIDDRPDGAVSLAVETLTLTDGLAAAAATLEALRERSPQPWRIARRVEAVAQAARDLVGGQRPGLAADLLLRPVTAAAVERDGLVPWAAAATAPLQGDVAAGHLLRWDDLAYRPTDPTVRMVLLQRRLVPAEEV